MKIIMGLALLIAIIAGLALLIAIIAELYLHFSMYKLSDAENVSTGKNILARYITVMIGTALTEKERASR